MVLYHISNLEYIPFQLLQLLYVASGKGEGAQGQDTIWTDKRTGLSFTKLCPTEAE